MSYFDRIRKSDVHVTLDHVTLSKGDFVNRTRIQQRDGRVMWLTIPVHYGKPIGETKIHDWDHVREKHLRSLQQAYGSKASRTLPRGMFSHLNYVAWHSAAALARLLGEPFRAAAQFSSSELGGTALGKGSDLILNLCRELGADVYLSGMNGRGYLDLDAFEKAGVEVRWHDWPVVQPVLSAVHDLFGKETS